MDRRKDLGEQVQEKVTPDSQKSYTEKAGENISGTYDKAAGALQPGTLLLQQQNHPSIMQLLISPQRVKSQPPRKSVTALAPLPMMLRTTARE
jgi:hypothetical protein